MKSELFKKFISDIKEVRRNPKEDRVLSLLDEESTNPNYTVKKDMLLYRGRLIRQGDDSRLGQSPEFSGFDANNSLLPPRYCSKDMRASYKYIPYLYCADHKYLAIAELRPHIGNRISVATIEPNDTLKIFDLTANFEEYVQSQDKIEFLGDLAELFSYPVDSEDNIEDYIPTQYIAEYIRFLGYDGMAYKSSLDTYEGTHNAKKRNLVIFEDKKLRAIRSDVYEVTGINIECKPSIISPIEEQLQSI